MKLMIRWMYEMLNWPWVQEREKRHWHCFDHLKCQQVLLFVALKYVHIYQ